MRRYGLRDDQWDRIKDLLPGREGHVGGTAEDNRLFVEAVLCRFRTGCPWRDLPERFGHWKTVHQRFSRRAKGGVFERVFKPHDGPCRGAGAVDTRTETARRPNGGRASGAERQPMAPRWRVGYGKGGLGAPFSLGRTGPGSGVRPGPNFGPKQDAIG